MKKLSNKKSIPIFLTIFTVLIFLVIIILNQKFNIANQESPNLPTSFVLGDSFEETLRDDESQEMRDSRTSQDIDKHIQDQVIEEDSQPNTQIFGEAETSSVNEVKNDGIINNTVEVPCVNTLQAKIIRSYTFNHGTGEIPGQFRASYEPLCNDPKDIKYEWYIQGRDYNINGVSGLFATTAQPSFDGYQNANYQIYLRVTSETLGWSQIESWLRITNGRQNTAPVVSILVPSYNGVPYTRKVRDDGSHYITFYTDSVINDYHDKYVENEKIQWFFERQNGERNLLGYGYSLYYVDFTLPSCEEDTFKLVLKATDWEGLIGEHWLEREIVGDCS